MDGKQYWHGHDQKFFASGKKANGRLEEEGIQKTLSIVLEQYLPYCSIGQTTAPCYLRLAFLKQHSRK